MMACAAGLTHRLGGDETSPWCAAALREPVRYGADADGGPTVDGASSAHCADGTAVRHLGGRHGSLWTDFPRLSEVHVMMRWALIFLCRILAGAGFPRRGCIPSAGKDLFFTALAVFAVRSSLPSWRAEDRGFGRPRRPIHARPPFSRRRSPSHSTRITSRLEERARSIAPIGAKLSSS